MRIAYLGPAGTFTEDALREALGPDGRVRAAANGDRARRDPRRRAWRADRALVPFENSIEGSVRSTLDALAFDTEGVTIVGEHDFAVRAQLIAREEIELEEITAVLSHPQPLAQCARFLRESLQDAERRSVSSTAEAVRQVAESNEPWAAIGARSAAELYGCTILARERSRTRATTSPASSGSPRPAPRSGRGAPGRPPSSSPSSEKTTPALWSRRCRSSPPAAST